MNSPGHLLARALTGAWRFAPVPPGLSPQELEALAPLLLGSGAGALLWWHIQHTDLQTHPAALRLQQAYRFQTLQAALREKEIQQLCPLLRAAGVEPILIKGWVNARLYAEKGLRPYGDIDLCVHPAQYEVAQACIQNSEWRACLIELHAGLTDLDDPDDLSWHALTERCSTLHLDGVPVRVLAAEDHLRLLCLHFLRHGAWRPLWLCDIAAAVESRPADFDWPRCLGANARRADWVICTLGLAHHLLGLEIAATPLGQRANQLPGWLVPAVLQAWNTPCIEHHPLAASMTTTLRHPLRLPQALLRRWPNPFEATIGVKAPFNEYPRLFYQLNYSLWRTLRFLRRR